MTQIQIHRRAWPALAEIFDPAAETCAFIIGTPADKTRPAHIVSDFWPTPNRWQERPGGRAIDQGYSIPAAAWQKARKRAAAEGLTILGHVHTHPGSTARPSFWDYRTVKGDDLGAVWHLHSGRLTFFNRKGVICSYAVDLPPVMRAMANLAASQAVDLGKLPAPIPSSGLPTPRTVRTYAHRALDALQMMVKAQLTDGTSITSEGLIQLAMALGSRDKIEDPVTRPPLRRSKHHGK